MKTTDPWTLLLQELDTWIAQKETATLWWRDDDAISSGPKLDRLIRITSNFGLLLAVIPATVNSSLEKTVANAAHVQVAQHGYAHINHAPRGQGLGAWEIGLHRGHRAVLDDLDKGRAILEDLFGDDFLSVLVPPWNRIDFALFDAIAARHYCAVSAFGPRTASEPVPGLTQINAHCDPIRWKGGAHFGGEAKTLNQLISHLQSRRTGTADAHEPTGFLTHHIDMDDTGWEFCERLVSVVNDHSGAQWLYPDKVFSPAGSWP